MSLRARSVTTTTTPILIYKASGGTANVPQFVRLSTNQDIWIAGTEASTQQAAERAELTSADDPLVLPLINGTEIWSRAQSTTAEIEVLVTGYTGLHDDVNPDT